MSYFYRLIFGISTILETLFIFMPFTGQGILAKNTKKTYQNIFYFFNKIIFEEIRWFT